MEETSYIQVVPSPEFDALAGKFTVLSQLYDLFERLSGQLFKPGLSMSKFLGLKDILNVGIQRADLEIMYKKTCPGGSSLDFIRFIECIENLAVKLWPADNISESMTYFLGQLKPAPQNVQRFVAA